MNAIEETAAAVTDVSIPKEVIIAHVQTVTDYTMGGRAGVRRHIN